MKSTSIRTHILLLTFYTSILPAFNLNSTSTPQNDSVSLLAFKSKADPGNKLPFSGNESSTFCNWPGVQCRNDHKVIRLVLESLNLSGVFAANTLTRMDQLRVLSLRNNSLTGPITDLAGLVNLKVLYLNHNYFTGVIPATISSLHRLRTLDLSFNKLSGIIPVELTNSDRLTYLRLDSNRFNGSLPPFNQSFEIFNVSVNCLTGRVPVTRTLARFSPNSFLANPLLCGEIVRKKCGTEKPFVINNSTKQLASSQGLLTTHSKQINRKRIGFITGISVGLLMVLVAMFVLCVIISFKKSEKKMRKEIVTTREMMELAEAADAAAELIRMNEANELEMKVKMLHQGIAAKKSGNLVFCSDKSEVYTVEQLMRASAEVLGVGSLGTTYKAVVDNRVVVCVKRLDNLRIIGMTNEVFDRHMRVLGGVSHQNVVALRAYLQTEGQKLVVFDYQPNGSLFSLIHGSKSTLAKPLHWTSCLKIAEDVAQGLSYLHETCTLVHGNLKSSNVLLGSDFEARVSDYYLSALFHHLPNSNNHVNTAYKAPETEEHHQPTADSDVYSFGIVLLELLTGKCASEHPDLITDNVVSWVKSSREKGGGGMKTEEKLMELMAEVVAACTITSQELRPTMRQVIKMLQEIKEAAVIEDCGLGVDQVA